MNVYNGAYMRASWSDSELNRIREYRKLYARMEQKFPYKEIKKECQKYIKASTLLIDFFYGNGAFKNKADSSMFPVELQTHLYIVLNLLGKSDEEFVSDISFLQRITSH